MGVKVRENPKGSGVFYVFIAQNGKRKSKKVGTEKKAKKVKEELESQIALNEFSLTSKKEPTFQELSTEWVETIVENVNRATTYQRYKQVLKDHANPHLGADPITKITRGQIKTLLLGLKKNGSSRSSITTVKNVISGVFNHARDSELIRYNPCDGILRELKLTRQKQIDTDPFTDAEKDRFLETCREHFSDMYPFFFTAFQTGLRLGELLALEWGKVDFHGRFLVISKSFRNGLESGTKTGAKRYVDMTEGVIEELKKLRLQHKKEALAGTATDLVFHRKGTHMTQNYARRYFERILDKAGLRKIRFHDIRHTYASLLVSKGAILKYVSQQMGHSSIDTTLDCYSRFIPQGGRSEVNLLESGRQPSASYVQVGP